MANPVNKRPMRIRHTGYSDQHNYTGRFCGLFLRLLLLQLRWLKFREADCVPTKPEIGSGVSLEIGNYCTFSTIFNQINP